MSPPLGQDTDLLLDLAASGDAGARQRLLAKQRDRLRKIVAYHLDRRLAARVDPSDVVQEALADAAGELADYLRRRPVPFYPWLRQLAWDRLVEIHRRHVAAGKRSVRREEPGLFDLPGESANRRGTGSRESHQHSYFFSTFPLKLPPPVNMITTPPGETDTSPERGDVWLD